MGPKWAGRSHGILCILFGLTSIASFLDFSSPLLKGLATLIHFRVAVEPRIESRSRTAGFFGEGATTTEVTWPSTQAKCQLLRRTRTHLTPQSCHVQQPIQKLDGQTNWQRQTRMYDSSSHHVHWRDGLAVHFDEQHDFYF